MAESEGQSVNLSTKWGGLTLSGRESVLIFLFIIDLVLGGLIIWARTQNHLENTQVLCAIKLNLFMQTIPKGETLDWSRLPVDLFGCVPKFLYERPTTR